MSYTMGRANHHGLMLLVGLYFEEMLEEDLEAAACEKSRVRLCPSGVWGSFSLDLLTSVYFVLIYAIG